MSENLIDSALKIEGFVRAAREEPIRPIVCTYCGCQVSMPYATKHRERCVA